ncbi:MAG: response regulator [Treponema sp.]|jgi:signal transduction histidine kinase/ActR/RegA family two-component response regulator|nr:response regulator [Treponema sp.]
MYRISAIEIISFLLILTGGSLISVSAFRYRNLLRTIETEGKLCLRLHLPLWMMIFFVAAYVIGAVNALTRQVDFVFFVVSLVFCFGGLFVYIIVGAVINMTRDLNQSKTDLKATNKKMEAHNHTLEEEIETRTQNLVAAREEALANAEAKSIFLANMSHEIRTPINAVIGMAAIARRAENPERLNDCLNKIDAASQHLLNLVNDILDMSKIESGKMELAPELFSIKELIENVTNTISVKMAEKQQTLIMNIGDNIPNIVLGDEMRLSQVCLNLLSNAVKFTPPGKKIFFTLNTLPQTGPAQEPPENVKMEITVKDQGIGISKEEMAHIFKPFQQADSTVSRRFGGTGLGLSISKRIAELMGGGITVESSSGQGSCFRVTFSLKAEDETTVLAEEEAETAEYNFEGFSALLVEDIEINREIILSMVEETGLKMACAENGEQALEIFKKNPDQYDLIYMDMQMPVMDGITATIQLRALDIPKAKTIPIIAMTANAFSEDVERCRAAGMNDHIAKPVDIQLFFAKTAQYLKIA